MKTYFNVYAINSWCVRGHESADGTMFSVTYRARSDFGEDVKVGQTYACEEGKEPVLMKEPHEDK